MRMDPASAAGRSLWWRRALCCALAVLVLLGVAAAIGRAVYLEDLVARGEAFRQWALSALNVEDPFIAERVGEVRRFDARFAAHPFLTLLHVLPGGLLLALGPLQFSRRIRNRHIRFHRGSGRLLVLATLVVIGTALYFGLLMPYGGPSEALATALFGGFGLAAVIRAYRAIRSGQVARHREWMIRAFAVAIGVSTIRVVGAVFDLVLTPAGYRPPEIFAISLWSGWLLTLGAAELWIRSTRPHSRSEATPARVSGRARESIPAAEGR